MFGENKIFGKVCYKIDEKGRIKIPNFTFVEKGENLIIFTLNNDIRIYNENILFKVYNKLKKDNAITDKNKYMRLIFGTMFNSINVDSKNRIVLLKNIREKLTQDKLIIIGCDDHIKLIDAKQYKLENKNITS